MDEEIQDEVLRLVIDSCKRREFNNADDMSMETGKDGMGNFDSSHNSENVVPKLREGEIGFVFSKSSSSLSKEDEENSW